jgi:UDP-N-acetylmuramate dehydrogenase
MPTRQIKILNDVPLAPRTTLGLGGNARYFTDCASEENILEALTYARTGGLRIHVLGGGSNTVVADDGFDGLVVKISVPGVSFALKGDSALVRAGAGEDWDRFVGQSVQRGLGGLECLSGIPGLVGATPVQNVGAYGQEVSDVIAGVRVIDRSTLDLLTLTTADCHFDYRQSRFKAEDTDRYIITEVTFALLPQALPTVRYPELDRAIKERVDISSLGRGTESLSAVRATVLQIRRAKSMLIDPADPNTKSVGSFFMNPVVDRAAFTELTTRWMTTGGREEIPHFLFGTAMKISAAWLVEKSGFPRGYRKGGVGISDNHSLALVNRGGTTRELLELAAAIEAAVLRRFGLHLQREPVLLQ